MSLEFKENVSESGLLVVVTGRTTSGKDSTTFKLREFQALQHLSLKQVVTTASRPQRPNEVHGVDYHFLSLEEMMDMEKRGEFIEPLTQTGDERDWKATQKGEILPILQEGRNVIWRIDLSRAAEVAAGGYFHKYLEKPVADLIESRTLPILIEMDPDLTAEKLLEMRKERDGKSFKPERYELRDIDEMDILNKYGHHFKIRVVNKIGKLDNTVESVSRIILDFASKDDSL